MQTLVIAVFRLILVIVALLVIKDLAYLFSPYAQRENINGVNIPLFVASCFVYLVFLAFLWVAPRTILKLSKAPIPVPENTAHQAFCAQLAVFCVSLYTALWMGSSLVDSLVYFLFSGEVGTNRGAYLLHLMSTAAIVAMPVLTMYKSKTIAQWFFRLK